MKGKHILITRALDEAGDLCRKLKALGADVVCQPMIQICDPPDGYKALDNAIKRLNEYDWLVFTSANAAERFVTRLHGTIRHSERSPVVRGAAKNLLMWRSFVSSASGGRTQDDNKAVRPRLRIAAVGPATARMIETYGLPVYLIPKEHSGRGLAKEFKRLDMNGMQVLFPRALKGRGELVIELKKMGAVVDVVPAYDSKIKNQKLKTKNKRFDAVVFYSPSQVDGFIKLMGKDGRSILKTAKVFCIGPTTAEAVKKYGVDNPLVPKSPDRMFRLLTANC